MTYYLGIDVGTTYTAAAVWRDGRNEIASLGNRAPAIPSVVLLRDDQAVLTGEAAVRRAATEPARVAREFKRRIGDPTPIIVGGTPYSADALVAKLVRWVVDQVAAVEGGPPAGIAVSHPANWGNYKLDLLHQAIRLADLDDVATLSEPEAAAIHYASQERVEPGSVIAVYDLGGGTFDAAVLRKTDDGWAILGSPEGIERLGGVDFDAAVYHHVVQATGGAIDALDPLDPTAQAAVARLRQDCVDAKEALSADSDVSIPVLLPNLQTEVRLTRGEYEQMVRPALADTITATNRALRSAGVGPDDVTAVLLVGGSSRTPLVAELVSSALGRPVAVDAHPKHGVALGAAITAARRARDLSGDGTSPETGDSAAAAPAGRGSERGPSSTPVAAATAPVGADVAPSTAVAAGDTAIAPAATRADMPVTAVAGPTTTDRAAAPTARTPASPAGPDAPGPDATRRDQRSVTVPYAGDRLPAREGGAQAGGDPGRAGGRGAAGSGGGPATRGDDRRATVAATGSGGRRSTEPATGSGRGDGGRSRRPAALVGGALLALVLVGTGAYLAFGGPGDDDPGAEATDEAGGASASPSDGGGAADVASDPGGSGDADARPPESSETAVPPGPFVQLDEVVLDGGQYRVNYRVTGYEPQLDGGPDSLHVHFFFDTQPAATAGSNGPEGSDWDVTDDSASFLTKYTPAGRGSATQMCSAVANVDHSVHHPEATTGTCVDLPS